MVRDLTLWQHSARSLAAWSRLCVDHERNNSAQRSTRCAALAEHDGRNAFGAPHRGDSHVLGILTVPAVLVGPRREGLAMGAGISVSSRDDFGGEWTTDLEAVQPGALAAGSPWRVFRWRRGQAHYSGWYWSATTGRHVVYESRLELARLLLADFDPRVVAIAAQPFCVTADVDGLRRRHVPDFLLLGADGLVTVVNVKPADQLARPKVAAALTWAGEVFTGRGWRHEVWSGAPPAVLANVRFLAAYRYPDRVDAATVSWLERQVTTSGLLGDLENGAAGQQVMCVPRPCTWSGGACSVSIWKRRCRLP